MGEQYMNQTEEPKEPNGKNGIIIFFVIVLALFSVLMVISGHGANTELQTKMSSTYSGKLVSNNQSLASTDSAQSVISESSSPSTVALTDIADLRNSAKEEAIEWAMDNMEQYGKVSSGTFSEQTGLNAYTLRYDYRAPNEYGTKEKHVLYLIYTESNSEWQLHAATADGESLQIVEK
jgi:hypothetical protein